MKRFLCALALAATTAFPALAQTGQGTAAAEPAVIMASMQGRLLADPATGRVSRDQTLVIENGRVREIRDGFVGEGRTWSTCATASSCPA